MKIFYKLNGMITTHFPWGDELNFNLENRDLSSGEGCHPPVFRTGEGKVISGQKKCCPKWDSIQFVTHTASYFTVTWVSAVIAGL